MAQVLATYEPDYSGNSMTTISRLANSRSESLWRTLFRYATQGMEIGPVEVNKERNSVYASMQMGGMVGGLMFRDFEVTAHT